MQLAISSCPTKEFSGGFCAVSFYLRNLLPTAGSSLSPFATLASDYLRLLKMCLSELPLFIDEALGSSFEGAVAVPFTYYKYIVCILTVIFFMFRNWRWMRSISSDSLHWKRRSYLLSKCHVYLSFSSPRVCFNKEYKPKTPLQPKVIKLKLLPCKQRVKSIDFCSYQFNVANSFSYQKIALDYNCRTVMNQD